MAPAPDCLIQRCKVDESQRFTSTTDDEIDIDKVCAALNAMPNGDEENYDNEEWSKIGRAAWRGSGGDEKAKAAFHVFSKRSKHYDYRDTEKRWNAFAKERPGSATVASLFWRADRTAPSWREDAQRAAMAECAASMAAAASGNGADTSASPDPDTMAQADHPAKNTAILVRAEMMTDLGNARRLVRTNGRDLRYVPEWCGWIAWQGGHWRRDGDGFAMRQAKATVEEMFDEAGRINDEDKRKEKRKHALQCQSAPRLTAMLKLAESESSIVLSVEKLDADPMLLGVQNGVIDLRTGIFREATREDYITKWAGVAFNAHAQCPNWKVFLRKILPDDVIDYLQRAVGYMLTGLTGEEVLFVLWGNGSNGKSTWRETIFALLADYAIASDASLLITPHKKDGGAATPDLARLHGRRIVTINETEENAVLNEARMKFITSHDKITARNLYEGLFDFTPTHKPILTTNHKPVVKCTDPGTWRRIHLIPFVKTIAESERDVNFREKVLLPELPGVLNWALEGLVAYRKQGLNPPKTVLDSTQEYRKDMDLVGSWIEERCERDMASTAKTADLYADYEQWATETVGFALSPIAFGRNLAARDGIMTCKVDGDRGLRGLRPLPLQPSNNFTKHGSGRG